MLPVGPLATPPALPVGPLATPPARPCAWRSRTAWLQTLCGELFGCSRMRMLLPGETGAHSARDGKEYQ